MSVVIVLAGAGSNRFTVTVSPLAELAASLHVLTEHTHHAKHAPWAEAVTRTAPPAFRAGLRRFAPLWTALRWRAFYPGSGYPGSGGATPGTPLTGLCLDRFAELTAYTCASGYHGFDFSRVLHDPTQAAALRQAAAALPEPHLHLAEDLLRDPRGPARGRPRLPRPVPPRLLRRALGRDRAHPHPGRAPGTATVRGRGARGGPDLAQPVQRAARHLLGGPRAGRLRQGAPRGDQPGPYTGPAHPHPVWRPAPAREERAGPAARRALPGRRPGGGRHPGPQPPAGAHRSTPGTAVPADRPSGDDHRRPGGSIFLHPSLVTTVKLFPTTTTTLLQF